MSENKLPDFDRNSAEKAFRDFLYNLGLDLEDPHLADTPKRVTKLFCDELFKGVYSDPPSITSFENKDDSDEPGGLDSEFSDQLIFSGPLTVRSTCSHHFLPIMGSAYVGIILEPKSKLPGLSKYSRIVDHFSSKPQVQERLTKEISNHLFNVIRPKGLGVTIKAKHMCQCHRGIKDANAMMITTDLKGIIKSDPKARSEFFEHVKMAMGKE